MTVARNSLFAMTGVIVPLAITIVTLPIFISVVGAERYGAIALCWLILIYVGGADFGISQAATQRIASLGAKRPATQAKVMATAFAVSLVMAVCLGLAAWGGSHWYFSGPLDMTDAVRHELQRCTWLIGLATGIVSFSSVIYGCLVGRQEFKVAALSTMIANAGSQLIPLAVAILVSPTMPALVAATIVSRVLGSLPAALRLWNSVLRHYGLHFRRREASTLLRYGKWVMVTSFTQPILLGFDRFLIGAQLGASAVAAYTVPFQIASRLQLLPQSVLSVLFPHFAALDSAESQRNAQQYLLIFACIFAPVIVGVICLVAPLLDLWLGAQLDPRSVLVGRIILAAYWLAGLNGVASNFILARGDSRFMALLRLAQVPCYLALLFAGSWLYGLPGVAVAFGAYQAFDLAVMLWRSGVFSLALLRKIVLSGVPVVAAVLLHVWLDGWLASLLAASILCSLSAINAFFSFPLGFWRDLVGQLTRLRKAS